MMVRSVAAGDNCIIGRLRALRRRNEDLAGNVRQLEEAKCHTDHQFNRESLRKIMVSVEPGEFQEMASWR